MRKKIIKLAIIIALAGVNLPESVYSQTPEADNSISGQLTVIEKELFTTQYDKETVIQRMERLEGNLFGKSQQGSLFDRLARINRAVNNGKKNVIDIKSNRTNNNHIQPPVRIQSGENTDIRTPAMPGDDIPGLMQKFPSVPAESKDNRAVQQQSNNLQEQEEPIPELSNKKPKKKKNKQQQEPEPVFDPNTPSYYDTLLYVNQGKVIRWKNMPVKIFLPEGNNITYRPEYRKAAIRAFDIWKVKSNGKIDYVLVDNPKKADIKVVWQDSFPEAERAAGQTSTSTGFNQKQNLAGNLVSSSGMFMPGYFGYAASLLGAIVGGIGNREAKIRDVHLFIGTLPAMKLDIEEAVKVIESIAGHEYGHSVGISCHSVNQNDLMFNEIPLNGESVKHPTSRDIATVVELYSFPPDISD